MSEFWDMAVVGGGAAGLTAAVFGAEAGARVVVLDGAPKLGAKILVAGGGRCNVTHEKVGPDDFHGPRTLVRNVLRAFDEQATVRWFEEMGVTLKREETGKLFPVTDRAATVLNALLDRCRELGVTIRTQCRVKAVEPTEEGFAIRHSQGEERSKTVILATGGRSLPKTGSDGFGWELAKRLGHTVTPTYPALVPLVLEERFFHTELSGLSGEVELSVFVDGALAERRTGSLLWTHFGVSGPVVLDASRVWVKAKAEGRDAAVRVNLLPGQKFEQVEKWLVDLTQRQPGRPVARVIGEKMPARMAQTLVRHAQVAAEAKMGDLTREKRRVLVHALTDLELPVVRDRGWNYAEVTAGGVPLEETDYRTMASRRVEGLYLVGEMLDCEGRIGGFNFQWAWATGYLAGKAAGTKTTG